MVRRNIAPQPPIVRVVVVWRRHTSRSSGGTSGSTSPKIELTVRREALAGSFIGIPLCDEDHILAVKLVYLLVTLSPHAHSIRQLKRKRWPKATESGSLDLQA